MGSSKGERESRRASRDELFMSQQLFNAGGPIRDEIFGQVLEALQTGGVGARTPIVARSMEASKAGTSRAISGIQGDLARSGLQGSSFGASLLADTRLSGELESSLAGVREAQGLSALAPSLGLGSAPIALSGVGQASAGFAGSGQLELARRNQVIGGSTAGLGGLLQAIAGAFG